MQHSRCRSHEPAAPPRAKIHKRKAARYPVNQPVRPYLCAFTQNNADQTPPYSPLAAGVPDYQKMIADCRDYVPSHSVETGAKWPCTP